LRLLKNPRRVVKVMLEDIKRDLRIKNASLDGEVQDLIDGAKQDLILSGVLESKVIDTDPLIKRAINVYCKANFGNNPDADRLQKSYNLLKAHLSLSFEYTDSDVAGDTDAG
jgi:uncharacterized phage protein (predicted DNA packaging)